MAEGLRPRFKELGSFGVRRTIRFARVKIQMGLRRRVNVRVDDPRGVLAWALTYKTHTGTLDGPIQLEPGDALAVYLGRLGPISRADYVWEFRKMIEAAETSSFIITDLFDGRDYLVEFEEDELTYEMVATQLFTSGVLLVQVDNTDVATLADGSLGEFVGGGPQI